MNEDERKKEKLIAKFEKIKTKHGIPFSGMGGGIFTRNTREKILGTLRQAEPGKSKADFWFDRRNQVERALIDLHLFIEVAGKRNVNQVITEETLKPIVEALLWRPVVAHAKPDLKRAEIAHLLIRWGFAYLDSMKRLPLSSRRTIEEAVDLSENIVDSFMVMKEIKEGDRP